MWSNEPVLGDWSTYTLASSPDHSQFFFYKWESLGGEITCGQLHVRNHFVQQGIESYTIRKNRVSSAICVVFHRYGFITRRQYKRYLYSDWLIWLWIQLTSHWSSKFKCQTFCTLLTVMLINIFCFGWIHDLTSKIRSNNALQCLLHGSIP